MYEEIRSESNSTKETDMEREINLYYTLEKSKYVAGKALEFWKDHCTQLPLLAPLAQIYMSMCCTSVPVESMFSTAALICNGKRSSLTSLNFEKILFIHDNFNHVKTCLSSDFRI